MSFTHSFIHSFFFQQVVGADSAGFWGHRPVSAPPWTLLGDLQTSTPAPSRCHPLAATPALRAAQTHGCPGVSQGAEKLKGRVLRVVVGLMG